MDKKARYLTIGVLLIMLSIAVFKAPSHAQDTGKPEATEDPCPAIIEVGMKPQDNPVPMATDDPVLDSCLETLSTTVMDTSSPNGLAAREAAVPAATETVASATEAAGSDSVYIPITVSHSNNYADAGRVWVTWHDPSTGALTVTLSAYGTHLSYYNMGLDVTIPDNVVDIGIRIETSPDRSSNKWQINPTCGFAFAEQPQGFSVSVDDNNVCTGEMENDATSEP